jgi:solute:Na+ symporter, SSS family
VNLHLTLLIAYAAALTALGVWIGRRVRLPGDFFVAGRRLTWPLVLATVLSSNIGAGALVTATGLAYQQGVSAWWWNGGAGLASLVLAFVIGPRLWRLASSREYFTIGDFLEDRYGREVRAVVTSLVWVGTLAILAAQLIAGARVLAIVAGTSHATGVLIGGIAMTAYFAAGGLLSSAWVNAVQLVVLVGGLSIGVPLLVDAIGLDAMRTVAVGPGYWDVWYSAGAMSGWTLLLLLGPNFIISPGLVQKTFGAVDTRAVRLGVGLNGLILMLFACVPVAIGIAARASHPGLAPDDVLPTVLLNDLPLWLSALALAAVFSAEVSTCDAILFMLATSLSKDLYKRFVRPDAPPARVLLVARLAAIVGGVGGMLLALQLPTILAALAIFFSLVGATLFVPVVGGLFVKRAGTPEALAAIACGMIGLLSVQFGTDRTGWWNPNLWGLMASAAAFTAVWAFRRVGLTVRPAEWVG